MDEIVSTHSHNLVVDADDQLPILSDNGEMVLLSRVEDDSLHYYPLEVVEEVFGRIPTRKHPVTTCQSSSSVPIQASFQDMPSTSKDNMERRITWTHKDIMKLIHIYKEHASLFKSQTVRHEKIWKMMAQSMPGFSAEQIKNKFKYLKGRYVKKIENMSDKASGEEKFVFEYFEEFNEMFGKDPNIKPVSIASSLKKRKLHEDEISIINKKTLNTLADMQENINTDGNVHPEPVMEIPRKKKRKKLGKQNR